MTTLRRATVADADALAELGERTFVDTFASFNTPENMRVYLQATYSPALQRAELEDPSLITIVAEREGRLIGFVQLEPGASDAQVSGETPCALRRLYVEKEALGAKVGPALMDEALACARSLGCQTLWLGVWEHNARAIRFYEKYGLKVVGDIEFMLGDDRQRDLVMSTYTSP